MKGSMRAAMAALVATVGLACFAMPSALAAKATITTPPVLTLTKQSSGRVKVAWKFTSPAPQSARTLTIERAVDEGAWSPLLVKAKAPLQGSYLDGAIGSHKWAYRAQVNDGTITTDWGATVSLGTVLPPPVPEPLGPFSTLCAPGSEQAVLAEINVWRANNGRPAALVWDDLLGNMARDRSTTQANARSLDNHVGLPAMQTKWSVGGVFENLAISVTDPVMLVDNGWAQSPDHRANMLNASGGAGLGCVMRDTFAYWTFDAY